MYLSSCSDRIQLASNGLFVHPDCPSFGYASASANITGPEVRQHSWDCELGKLTCALYTHPAKDDQFIGLLQFQFYSRVVFEF